MLHMIRTMYKKSHWQQCGLEGVVPETEREEAILLKSRLTDLGVGEWRDLAKKQKDPRMEGHRQLGGDCRGWVGWRRVGRGGIGYKGE